MKTGAQMAGFMLRAQSREETAAFYRKLGLSADEHAHGGPIHFELGPTSPSCVAEIYKSSPNFPKDALMVQVLSIDAALTHIGMPVEIRDVSDMRLAYVTDPDGRAVMVFEEIAKPVTGLAGQKCLPCTGKVSVLLTLEESSEYLDQLGGDWKIAASSWYSGLVWNLQKTFKLTDFASAMKFIAAVGKIAEEEQHHPDFALIRYSYVQISIFTRTINGLSINDFIVAAKIDALVK